MPLHQLKIKTTQEFADAISDFLPLFDAQAVALADAGDHPILEPKPNETPLWPEVWVNCIFIENVAIENIITFIKTQLGAQAIVEYYTEEIAEQQWERAWLKDFHPMQFGKHLWIFPSVITPPDPTAINIILDPGLAFGTGTHPTTALCLEWLDANPPKNKVVIDYGCGSGILAIAALKLGAKEVWAVDYDEQALIATHENAQRNEVNNQQLHICYPEQLPEMHCDLLLANIIVSPLIELAPRFNELIKNHGHLVLSGILLEQEQLIRDAYHKNFKLSKAVAKQEWIRLDGTKV